MCVKFRHFKLTNKKLNSQFYSTLVTEECVELYEYNQIITIHLVFNVEVYYHQDDQCHLYSFRYA